MIKRYTRIRTILLFVAALACSSTAVAQQSAACCAPMVIPPFAILCVNATQANCLAGNGTPGNTGSSCTLDSSTQFASVQDCFATVDGLPVELVSFDALVQDQEVHLVWSTASELSNSGFAVEREVGSDIYEEIGFVEGHGTTNEFKEYRFVVGDVSPGVNRFRLKQIDFDGAFEYSPVVEAVVAIPDQFVIEPAYPNPFNPSTTFRFAVALEQDVTVTLVNAAGQTVRSVYAGTVPANDMKSLTIDAGGLPSGTYMIRVQGEQGFSDTQAIVLAK